MSYSTVFSSSRSQHEFSFLCSYRISTVRLQTKRNMNMWKELIIDYKSVLTDREEEKYLNTSDSKINIKSAKTMRRRNRIVRSSVNVCVSVVCCKARESFN